MLPAITATIRHLRATLQRQTLRPHIPLSKPRRRTLRFTACTQRLRLLAEALPLARAIDGRDEPERLPHWRSDEHELDFVLGPQRFVEVKRGRATALDFGWFGKLFPRGELTVICSTPFETDRVRGISMRDFLAGAALR